MSVPAVPETRDQGLGDGQLGSQFLKSGGESYYFRTRMVGISYVCPLLDQLDSDEGRWFVAWPKFSNSHSKN